MKHDIRNTAAKQLCTVLDTQLGRQTACHNTSRMRQTTYSTAILYTHELLLCTAATGPAQTFRLGLTRTVRDRKLGRQTACHENQHFIHIRHRTLELPHCSNKSLSPEAGPRLARGHPVQCWSSHAWLRAGRMGCAEVCIPPPFNII